MAPRGYSEDPSLDAKVYEALHIAHLYERAGELPRARDLFQRVRNADPDFADVQLRLRALR